MHKFVALDKDGYIVGHTPHTEGKFHWRDIQFYSYMSANRWYLGGKRYCKVQGIVGTAKHICQITHYRIRKSKGGLV